MTPVETAVWWIEYTIRNRGAPHLKYKGTEMSFFEYFLLDVIFVNILMILLITFSMFIMVKTCLNALKHEKPKSFKRKIT